MSNLERTSSKNLKVGGRYRHKNGTFVREIARIEGQKVFWFDDVGPGACSKSKFIQSCPTVEHSGEREVPRQDGRAGFREEAMFIAMVVRNGMEDFHSEHLSDDQMRELNPIIRNSIFTALCAMEELSSEPRAAAFVAFQKMMIPDYWEAPELLDDYRIMLGLGANAAGELP